MSLHRRMDKEDEARMYRGILLNLKKERNSAICGNMGGPRDEPTKSVRKTKISTTSLTYGI